MMPKLKRPRALKPGDLVRVVASSSPFSKREFLAGVKTLQAIGLRVAYQGDIFARTPYLAGSDRRRFQELAAALGDPKTRAVFFARGGYGAARLLPMLERIRPRGTPKILLGYSDITSLLTYAQRHWGWTVFYGPVVAKDLGPHSPVATRRAFQRAITTATPLGELRFPRAVVVRSGVTCAPLVGGCLTLIHAALGTPYEIDTKDKILFLEDVNEKPYQIDRMLTHLKHAGKFLRCQGVVFGSLAGPNPLQHYIATIRDVLAFTRFPILANIPAGHSKIKLTIPFGVRAKLSSRRKSLTFLEAALTP